MINLQHKAIICVSENIQRLKTIERLLSDNFGKSYVIEIAESSIEVMDIIATLSDIGVQTSVLISDYRIFDMTGLELVHLISRRNDNIKTMLMTEEADIDFAQKLVNHNNVYSLIKLPLNNSHFIQLVSNACNQYETDAELVRMMKRLRVSEEEKSLILESISESIIYMDMDKRIVWKNSVADKELFDTKNNDKEPTDMLSNICDNRCFENVFEEDQPRSVEITMNQRHMLTRYFPVYDKDTLPIGIVITLLDITDRTRALNMNESLLEMSRYINQGDSMVLIYNKAYHLVNKYFDVKLMCMTGEDYDNNYVEYYGEGFKKIKKERIEVLIKSTKSIFNRNRNEELIVLKNDIGTLLAYPMHDKILLFIVEGTLSEGIDGIKYLNTIAEHIKIGIMKIDNYRKIVYQANHDSLTGLFSRSYFMERIGNHLKNNRKSEKEEGFYSLAVMDLNYFKDVNDNLSHLVGDSVLLEIAQRLQQTSREGDVIGRIGGDEFAILFQTGKRLEIVGLIQRLQAEIFKPIRVDEIGINIGSSFGIVYDISGYTNVDQLISDADHAMYEAKKEKSGEGSFVFFEKKIQNRVERQNRVEKLMRAADFSHELTMAYQPIIRLSDMDVVGYEGLVRWQTKTGEEIKPNEFIPIAEEFGGILDIGHVVVDMAIRDLDFIKNKGRKDQYIAINMTPGQMIDDDNILRIKKKLLYHGLHTDSLHIEMNDRFKESQVKHIADNVTALREFGIKVDLDDFGRGNSALSTLTRIDVDEVKIDGATIGKFRFDHEADAMVKSIVSVAKSLGLKVTAECVEKEEEFIALREAGCDYAQGYYFMRPDTLEAAMALSLQDNLSVPGH